MVIKKDSKRLQLQKNILSCAQKKCDDYFKKMDNYLKNFKECKSIMKKMPPKCLAKVKNDPEFLKLMTEMGNCSKKNCKKERDLLEDYILHKFDLMLQKSFQLEVFVINLIIKIKQSNKKVSKQKIFKTLTNKNHTPGQTQTIKRDIDTYYVQDIKTLNTKLKELQKSQSKFNKKTKKKTKKTSKKTTKKKSSKK